MAIDDLSPGPRTGLDKFFVDNFVIAIIISVCCALPGLIISILGVMQCKDPKAKSNATVCLIISGVLMALSVGVRFSGVLNR